MTLSEALSLVWQESARSSQADVARAIGVAPSALTLWKGGTVPKGQRRAKLLAWAEAIERSKPTTPLAGNIRVGFQMTGDLTTAARESATPYNGVDAVVRAGIAEQTRWVREFAARVLEASAAQIRALPVEPLPDLAVEEAARDTRQRQAAAAPRPQSAHG